MPGEGNRDPRGQRQQVYRTREGRLGVGEEAGGAREGHTCVCKSVSPLREQRVKTQGPGLFLAAGPCHQRFLVAPGFSPTPVGNRTPRIHGCHQGQGRLRVNVTSPGTAE